MREPRLPGGTSRRSHFASVLPSSDSPTGPSSRQSSPTLAGKPLSDPGSKFRNECADAALILHEANRAADPLDVPVVGPGRDRVRSNTTELLERRARLLAICAAVLFVIADGCARGHHDGSNTRAARPVVDTLSNGVPVALAREAGEWVGMWRKASPRFTPDSLIWSGRTSASLGFAVQPLEHSLVADTDSSVLREVMGVMSPTGRYALIADAYRALPDSEIENPAGGEADETAER